MKKILIPSLILTAMTLLAGCAIDPSLSLGGGRKTTTITQPPTVGQQLIDLQKAKASGAITDAEYQTEKAKILNAKQD